MGTTVGAGGRFQSGMDRGSLRIWLRLFLGISGAAVAIAVALGLLVVLAASASQAQAHQLPQDLRGQAVSATRAALQEPDHSAASAASASPGGTALVPPATDAAAQLAAGTVLLALGFGCLLSRRGSRLLAGGGAAKVG